MSGEEGRVRQVSGEEGRVRQVSGEMCELWESDEREETA